MKEPRIYPVEYAETIEDTGSYPYIEIRVPVHLRLKAQKKEGVRVVGCHYQPH
jgi:hypothetical protein